MGMALTCAVALSVATRMLAHVSVHMAGVRQLDELLEAINAIIAPRLNAAWWRLVIAVVMSPRRFDV